MKRASRRFAKPGMMPSLRAGRVMKASARPDVVHAQQQLAAAADRERVDRGDPRLLDATAVDFVGNAVGRREAPHHLVHVAEIADKKPEKGIWPSRDASG